MRDTISVHRPGCDGPPFESAVLFLALVDFGDDLPADSLVVPRWTWANSLSLDVVSIGLFWLLLFTHEFVGRWPSHVETSVICLTIWLGYTADRLLDSRKLDLSRPHTLRHRVHLDFRKHLVSVWTVVLAIDTVLIVNHATAGQLSLGYVGIGVILAYMGSVHLSQTRLTATRHGLPKELQSGLVFAFGVSFIAWSNTPERPSISLAVSTLMAGLLFATNCVSVACWEDDLDSSQGFASSAMHFPAPLGWRSAAILIQIAITIAGTSLQLIPVVIAACLIASSLLLLLLLRHSHRQHVWHDPSTLVQVRAFGLIADSAFVVPPMIGVLLIASFP